MARERGAVAALALSTTASYGVLFYAYGVLLVPMQHDLGWSRSFLSGALSIALIVSAALTVPVGRWLDRHEPRPLFLVAAVAATGLTVAWAMSRSRGTYLAVWVLLGGCQAVLFYEAAFTVLAKRLTGHERNRAITTVTLLAGLASTIFAPLVAALERALGWRGAVIVLAAILGAVTVGAFAIGLRRSLPAESRRALGDGDVLPAEAVRSRTFWLLALAYVLTAITTFGVGVHLVPFLRSRGISTGLAATALGGVGFVQVLGRSAFIKMSARRPSVEVATWVLAAKGVGLALLLLVRGLPGVVLFVVVYGSSNGIATLTRATTVAEVYGREHYGTIAGVIGALSGLAGACAPFLVAVAADAVGGVAQVMAGLVVLSLVSAAANEVVARSAAVERVAIDDVSADPSPEP